MGQMGQTERVILIKGDGTKWYNQAIFIVNQDIPKNKMPVDFVAEAERIINSYMARGQKPISVGGGNMNNPPVAVATRPAPAPRVAKPAAKTRRNTKTDFVLNMLMVLACVAIVATFVYGMLL